MGFSRQEWKIKALPHAIALAVSTLALSPLSIQVAHAQQADNGSAPVRVEITGSNIRRADKETPSPVQVISAEELHKSGYTTVSEVLRNITANGQGTLSQGFSQAFAAGASGISLRGLTVGATLVLIDGHRMAPYPLADDAQRSFVDISNIPFEAVERVEVLKDGASATYGSDAMAGVVNIILKKSFVGTKVMGEAGSTTEGGGTVYHASVIHGFGDYENDGYNAYASLEYRDQQHITYSQRKGTGLWQETNWAPYGGVNTTHGVPTLQAPQVNTLGSVYLTNPNVTNGTVLDPTGVFFYPGSCNYTKYIAGACAYVNPLAEIQPKTSNVNVIGSFSKKLSADWKLDVKASFFDSKAEQYPGGGLQSYPSQFQPNVAVSAGHLPTVVGTAIPSITVPANYPGNPFGVAANVNGIIPDAPIPNTQIDSQAVRLVADLTGSWADWDIRAAVGYTKVTTTQDVYGNINVPLLNAALNRATNPFSVTGGNSAADIAAIFPATSAKDTSELDFAEFHMSRSLMQLQGGDLGFSTGVAYTRRVLDAPAPGLVADGTVSGNNAFAGGTQTDASFYMEFAAPVLKTLELDASVRYDHFNLSGNSTTPKFGFKFTPIKELAVRGTYSQGFRAPNPAENGQAGNAYLAQVTNDPVLCPAGAPGSGQNYAAGSVISRCAFQPAFLNGANPNLQPEKSESGTIGFILEPISGWSTTLDFYSIKIKNQIVTGTPSPTPVRGSPFQTLCADGNGGTYTCTTSVGDILYYPNTFINANSTKTTGYELETRYKFKFGEYGNLTTQLDWTHVSSYVLTQGGKSYQLAGTHGPFIIGGDTGNPKDRVQATFTWDKGPLQVATTFNWISSFDLTDPSYGIKDCTAGATSGIFFTSTPPSQFCKVDSFLDTDVTVRYKLDKHWSFNGSITNLFNQAPPVDLNTYGGGQLPYNPSMHMVGAIGRFINVGVNYSF